MAQSNETTIQQMNIALAAFEGRKFYGHTIDKFGGDTHNALPVMKYHTSWDWLKPIIDKISEYILVYPEQVRPVIEMRIVVNIQAAHERVYLFCKWFNQQKQNNGTTENNAG